MSKTNADKWCGRCQAGIVVGENVDPYAYDGRGQYKRQVFEIGACPDCALFETDEDAAAAVQEILKLVDARYRASTKTVADVVEQLEADADRGGRRRKRPAQRDGHDECTACGKMFNAGPERDAPVCYECAP